MKKSIEVLVSEIWIFVSESECSNVPFCVLRILYAELKIQSIKYVESNN